ncbi:MAG: hypothetical protein LBO75_03965 [Bifidobacteriaceae bacterium]|jgi:hypothetical protein|nr:hypothetical protein [Bifidobacteriaceae bacterium]
MEEKKKAQPEAKTRSGAHGSENGGNLVQETGFRPEIKQRQKPTTSGPSCFVENRLGSTAGTNQQGYLSGKQPGSLEINQSKGVENYQPAGQDHTSADPRQDQSQAQGQGKDQDLSQGQAMDSAAATGKGKEQ